MLVSLSTDYSLFYPDLDFQLFLKLLLQQIIIFQINLNTRPLFGATMVNVAKTGKLSYIKYISVYILHYGTKILINEQLEGVDICWKGNELISSGLT